MIITSFYASSPFPLYLSEVKPGGVGVHEGIGAMRWQKRRGREYSDKQMDSYTRLQCMPDRTYGYIYYVFSVAMGWVSAPCGGVMPSCR